MTYEQIMALKFKNKELSHYDYVCKLCFRLFGDIFTSYCDSVVIEQLISMNFINTNVISNHERLRCCQRGYKSHVNDIIVNINEKWKFVHTYVNSNTQIAQIFMYLI